MTGLAGMWAAGRGRRPALTGPISGRTRSLHLDVDDLDAARVETVLPESDVRLLRAEVRGSLSGIAYYLRSRRPAAPSPS